MRFDYFGTLHRAKKAYTRLLDPLCRQYALTKNELDVLMFLHNNPEFDRSSDIVVHRGMTKSHVSLSVANLEHRGYLTRQEDTDDRRAVRLKLTEEALPLVREGQALQREFFTRMFHGISSEEAALWQQLMERVCRNIEEMDN